MKKVIIPILLGIVLLSPLILLDSFAQGPEASNTNKVWLKGVTNDQIIASFVISAIVISAVVLVFGKLGKKSLIEIIWNSNGVPTLSKFQFLLWTLVIAFSYFAIQIIVIIGTDYSGTYLLDKVPENLLALMGISVAVPVINIAIKEGSKQNLEKEGKFFGAMFYNVEGNLDLARLQMFLWTVIGIAIFLFTVFDQIGTLASTEKLFLPDVSPTLLILMGLSQTAYLGAKVAQKKSADN